MKSYLSRSFSFGCRERSAAADGERERERASFSSSFFFLAKDKIEIVNFVGGAESSFQGIEY